jgi:hypothetical protein
MDIQRWFNQSALERKVTMYVTNQLRLVTFKQQVDRGADADAAVAEVRKRCVMYADPPYEAETHRLNLDLPYVMYERVEGYIARRQTQDMEGYYRDVQRAGGINALIREGIREGRI